MAADRAAVLRPIIAEEPGALEICAALAKAGRPVVLVEPDADARRRLADMLPRALGDATANLTLVPQTMPSDIWLSGQPGAPICTNWPRAGGQTALRYAEGVAGPDVLEQVGPDPQGRIAEIAKALGTHLVEVPSGTIPLGARLHAVLGHALERALLEASTPQDLDAALVTRGFAIGPFALQDRLGIDTLLTERRAVEAAQNGPAPLPLFPRAVSEGRLGRKASVGWHRYPARYGPVEDPLVEDMAEEEAHFAGLPRSDRGAEELADDIVNAVEGVIAAQDMPEARAISASVLGYAP